jgi:hypothetical protein
MWRPSERWRSGWDGEFESPLLQRGVSCEPDFRGFRKDSRTNFAAMFPAPDTLFIETREGVLTAKPLMDPVPARPTNHQQHLLYATRTQGREWTARTSAKVSAILASMVGTIPTKVDNGDAPPLASCQP